MREIKSVALIGLGAMGAFFVPGLTAALGPGFRAVAAGERKARLEQGITVNGGQYAVSVVEPVGPAEPVDLVILAVKSHTYLEALAQAERFVGPDTIVMPVLNGLDCARQAGEYYGKDRVLYASMWVAASMEDGVATYNPQGLIRFGEARNDTLSPRVQAVEALFQKGGIRYSIEKDMLRCLWVKFMGNVSENLPCALLGVPYGAYQKGGAADPIRRALMEEVAAVAKVVAQVELSEEDKALRDQVVWGQNPASRPSTLQDLDRGKKTEVELFAGFMVQLGGDYGVPTPVSALMLHGIHVLEAKMAGTIPGL